MSFLAELDQLHREALDLARRFAAARVGATGTDPTGTVQVVVTGDGAVDAVTIDPGWRGRFGPDGLGDALAAATGDALLQRLCGWAGRLDVIDAEPAAAAMLPKLPELPDPTDLGELHGLALDAVSRLPELERLVEPAPTGGSSTDRRVRVMVTGGRVTGVEFDRRWLACATVTAIADHARQALRAAFAAADVTGLLDRGPVGEVRALTADPAALLRRLGLG